MLFLLRKIRRKLISTDNKFLSYLLYAIGEILLVVVGILIAVQIDNANNHSKERAKERVLIEEIHAEFELNRAQFDTLEENLFAAYNSMKWILDATPINDVSILNYDSLYHHFKNTISYSRTFKPSQSTIRSLVSTSSFEYISNRKLRELLIQWPDVLLNFQNAENELQEYRKTIMIPYVMKNMGLKKFYRDHEFNPSFMETEMFANQMWTLYYRYELLCELSTIAQVDEMIDRIVDLTANTK
ncbi:MAG: hypothetical protein RIA69_05520 [Cyclobacteriaceae bacterium]